MPNRAPALAREGLAELPDFERAIEQDFFSKSFLKRLVRAANKKLSQITVTPCATPSRLLLKQP